MLPSAHRMRRGTDFTSTTRSGTKVSRGRVVVYVDAPVPAADSPVLVGLIVGKAVGNSVQRHRASRRIRAAMAPIVAELPRGARIVVRALAGADVDTGLGDDVQAAVRRAHARILERGTQSETAGAQRL